MAKYTFNGPRVPGQGAEILSIDGEEVGIGGQFEADQELVESLLPIYKIAKGGEAKATGQKPEGGE